MHLYAPAKGLLSKSRDYSAEGVVEVENLAYDVRNRPTQQQWIVPGVGGGTFRWHWSEVKGFPDLSNP